MIILLILEAIIWLRRMKNKISLAQTALFMFLLILACQKEDTVEREYPQIRTSAVNHITADGARFNAEIISGDIESISEYGFVWGLTSTLSIQGSEKVVIGSVPSGNDFYSDITYALEEMKDYYVRSYVKAGELTIYGDAVKFKSLGSQAPVITDFEPKSATWGDTVTIYGKNFSNQNQTNVVFFGATKGIILKSTNEEIQVIVPNSLNKITTFIAVEVFGNRYLTNESFRLLTPGIISSINETDVTWGDTIELTGNFPFMTHTIKIEIGNVSAFIIESYENRMIISVPENVIYSDSVSVVLNIDGHKIAAPEKVHLKEPFIAAINPTIFGWGDTIELKGIFHPVLENNKVLFSNISAKILESSNSEIKCIVPHSISGHECRLSVSVNNFIYDLPLPVILSGPIVNSVSPNKGVVGKTITITGKYFKENNTFIKINGVNSTVSSFNPNVITSIIPNEANRGNASIEVSVYNKKITIDNTIFLFKPEIIDFSPKLGSYGDTITIIGYDFNPLDIVVNVRNYFQEIIEVNSERVKIIARDNISCLDNRIDIQTYGKTISATDNFFIPEPIITSYTPTHGTHGDTITITGDFFDPGKAEGDLIFMGGNSPKVISMTNNEIKFTVPYLNEGDFIIGLGLCKGIDLGPFHYED